ncbi:hypothetical protein MesoLj131c_62420 [Mesorhizobium sp. 131-3-5]|uniref:hypothetical protein n=1 Tax=Mesorhizobium sp. 131-3-5 TaxID=2744520 RepID=UPI001926B94A|nr:hypothetical protein [Mesorhizobium sp. 131-3-5]BCH11984.1 hypothetical protein MesoLj131c_62420 [Mesorhizobium sp. 131-3-5]
MLDRETDQNEAMEAAAPVLPLIYRILDESVSFYFSEAYSNEARAEHDNRAMANCIYSHAEKRMIGAADEMAGLHSIKVRGLHVLNYMDSTLTRFKKVGANGQHRNYQTRQQQDYDDQIPLPGIPEPAYRLTAGYQMDASGSALERIMIARPIGHNIFWTAQVTMIEGVARWDDITPRRFGGMEGADFDAERARERRGG